jgi:phage gp37-like protein
LTSAWRIPPRVYDYWLGGKDNYEADREAAEQVIAANPNVLPGVRANRAFLRRAVEYLVSEAGVRCSTSASRSP